MRSLFFGKSKKVLRSIILSYLVLLPLLLSAGAFTMVTGVLRQQIMDVADASAIQLQSAIDGQLMQDRVQDLKYREGRFEGLDLYNISRVLQVMRTQTLTNNGVRQIYVVYSSNGAVLSNHCLYYQEEFAPIARRDMDIGYDAWQEMIDFSAYRGFRIVGDGADKSSAVLLTPAVSSRYAASDLLVVILMDAQVLLDSLNSLSAEGTFQTLVIENGNPVISSGSASMLTAEEIAAMPDGQEALFWPRTVRKQIASEVMPQIAYVVIVPTDGYLSSFQRVMVVIALYFCLCVVVGSFLAILFALRQYTLLQKLVESVLDRVEHAQDTADDEYSALNRSLARLLEKEKQQESIIEEHANSIQSQMIRRILLGAMRPSQLDHVQKQAYHIALEEGMALVFLCEVDDVAGGCCMTMATRTTNRCRAC